MAINYPCCLIGGLAFGSKPFAAIQHAYPQAIFIDINQLTGLDLDTLSTQVAKTLSAHLSWPVMAWQVMAYSCGGLIAIRLAKNHPLLVKGIIFINSSPRFMRDFDWQGISYQAYHRLFSKLSNPAHFCNYFKNLCSYPKESSADNSWFSITIMLANLMKLILTSDLRNELNLLTVKVIFVYSDFDILVPFNPLNCEQYQLSNSTHLEINSKQLLAFLESIP